jgi:5'-deoxynucleotidase YfbR-like HD superfamily hydrolase
METKASAPGSLLAGQQVSAWIAAYYEINQLKQLYRQGWLQRGIPRSLCESVAEHSFSMALLALLLVDQVAPELDRQQVLLMALIHDLGEIYVGDFTPQDGMPSEDKHDLEARAIQQMFGGLPDGKRYIHLWQAYEQGQSPEARFVKWVDRLEMALQASIYARRGFPEMQDFFDSARAALGETPLGQLLAEVEALRPSLQSGPPEETIQAFTRLPGSPEQIYRAWLDSRAHSAFTGAAAVIDPQVGGNFSAWDGYIQGTTLELQPFQRILQSWRTSEFPPESPDSLLEVLLEPDELPGGTRLTLIHSQIPPGQGQQYLQGWQDYYFTPMQEYFSG